MRVFWLVMGLAGGALAQDVAGEIQPGPKSAAHRFEVTLAPATVQLNGRFTQHVGSFGTFTWHLRERLALQLFGGGNWYSDESGFNAELVDKFRVDAQAASSGLWTWGVFAGTEVEPIFGELGVFGGARARVGFVLSGGIGAGGTRHVLSRSDTSVSYGDTGVRLMATIAAGLRLRVGERFVARLDVRDVAYPSTVTSVNGCSAADVHAIVRRTQLLDAGTAYAAPGCLGFASMRDGEVARMLLDRPGSDVLHNLGLSIAAGIVF